MAGIVCAVRGGAASRPTIQKSIALAKELDQPLYFLYVVNLDFLLRTASSRVHAVQEELEQMGEFICLAAQENASKHGVISEGIVRKGNVMEEITAFCHEVAAGYLVLGRPQSQTQANTFDLEQLSRFQKQVENETGAQVVFAE